MINVLVHKSPNNLIKCKLRSLKLFLPYGRIYTRTSIKIINIICSWWEIQLSIATYKKFGSISEGNDPLTVVIEYPSNEELFNIIKRMEEIFEDQRRGFVLDIHGSCHKGPQGINWEIKIEFEDDFNSITDSQKLCQWLEENGIKKDALLR